MSLGMEPDLRREVFGGIWKFGSPEVQKFSHYHNFTLMAEYIGYLCI